MRWTWGGFAWGAMVMVACGARSELPVPDPTYCRASVGVAEPAPIDLLLLLDASGSMEQETASGATKFAEVTDAVLAFLAEPSLAGTEVGLAFFPEVRPEVPLFCNGDADCGDIDACRPQHVCLPSLGAACDTDARCAEAGFPDDTCEPLGRCDGTENVCLLGEDDEFYCGTGGSCVPYAVCTNESVCEPEAYTTGELVVLPDGLATIEGELTTKELEGGTPTLPAAAGALESARIRLVDVPSRKPVVVFATDGIPTRCDDDIDPFEDPSVDNVVATVADGAAAGIETFVIGVFEPDALDEARPNLDAIAAAGSTGSAFLIDTSGEVALEFLAALEQLRDEASRCVYTAPWEGGDAPAGSEVLLRVGDRVERLRERAGADACGDGAGFYFEAPPSTVARFALCPASCVDAPASVELAVRCE